MNISTAQLSFDTNFGKIFDNPEYCLKNQKDEIPSQWHISLNKDTLKKLYTYYVYWENILLGTIKVYNSEKKESYIEEDAKQKFCNFLKEVA